MNIKASFLIIVIANIIFAQSFPNYEPNALTPVSFKSYDRDFLGNHNYFSPMALTPNDISLQINGICDMVKPTIGNAAKWLKPLVSSDIANDDMQGNLSGSVDFFKKKDFREYFNSAYGICLANGLNNSDGDDNLFVFVNNKEGNIGFLDFASPDGISSNFFIEHFFKLYDLDIKQIKFPYTGYFSYMGRSDAGKLNNPQGICTDRKGHFWIADKGNNRIIHLLYNPSEGGFEFIGELGGLNGPADVCFSNKDVPVIAIADNYSNSVILTDAYFEGKSDLSTIAANKKTVFSGYIENAQPLTINSPVSIASNPSKQEEIIAVFEGNKIIKLKRSGSYGLEYSGAQTEWTGNGNLTCCKIDKSGSIYVIDNANNLILKYSNNLELIFSSGSYSQNQMTTTQWGLCAPKYLAISYNSEELYLTEKVEGWNGIKRFSSTPRFLQNSVAFHLDCNDPTKMLFDFALTSEGLVRAIVTKKVDGQPDEVIFDNNKFRFTGQLGSNLGGKAPGLSFPYKKHDVDGNPVGDLLPDNNISYLVDFQLYDKDHPDILCDERPFLINLSTPKFQGNTVAISQPYFNPTVSQPSIQFRTNRDMSITLKIVPEDGTIPAITMPEVFSKAGSDDVTTVKLSTIGLQPYPAKYKVFADLSGPDRQCFGLEENVLTTETEICLDDQAPDGTFTNFSNPAGESMGFNPNNPGFDAIAFDFTIGENTDALVNYSLDVVRCGTTDELILPGLSTGKLGNRGISHITWNGKDKDGNKVAPGQYAVIATLTDAALNKATIRSATIWVDDNPPVATAGFGSPEADLVIEDLGSQIVSLKGKNGVVLDVQNGLDFNFSVSDNLNPYKISMAARLLNQDGLAAGSAVNFAEETNTDQNPWNGAVHLDPSKLPAEGIYELLITATDKAGNKVEEIPVSSGHGSVRYLIVNRTPPVAVLNVVKNVIKSGESNELIITGYPGGTWRKGAYSMNYEVQLTHEGIPVPGFGPVSGTLTDLAPSKTIDFHHGTTTTLTGRFQYKVTLRDNLGTSGTNETSQTVDFFVDAFPPIVNVTADSRVPGRFYIEGQVGDPDPTNDNNEHGFEYYEVYYKAGAITTLPSSLSDWESSNIYVPFGMVDRDKGHFSQFPLSNRGDNQSAVTSAWGTGVLAYIDASPSGANLTPGADYTILVVSKEKGIPLAINSNTAVLKQFRIENSTLPGFTDLKININDVQKTDPVIIYRPENGNLNIQGKISGTGSQYRVTAYIYSETSDPDNDGTADGIVREVEVGPVNASESFKIAWDGRDGKGSYIKNGSDYRVLLVLKQIGTDGFEKAWTKELLTNKLNVVTPLQFIVAHLNPPTISNAPQGSEIPPSNEATLSYRTGKPSDTYIEVYRYEAGGAESYLYTLGPEKNRDGVGVWHKLTWNGTDPGVGPGAPIVTAGTYHLKPYLTEVDGSGKTYYHDPSNPTVDYFELTVTDVNAGLQRFGDFKMPNTAYGNSDIIWKAKPNGKLWRFPEVTTDANAIRLAATGEQTLLRSSITHFGGSYTRQHTKIRFGIKVKWKIHREAYKTRNGDRVGCCHGPDWGYINFTQYFTPSRPGADQFSTVSWSDACGMDDQNRVSGIHSSDDYCVAVPCVIPLRHSKMWEPPQIEKITIVSYPTNGSSPEELENLYVAPDVIVNNPLPGTGAFTQTSYTKLLDIWNGEVGGEITIDWSKLELGGFLPIRYVYPGDPRIDDVMGGASVQLFGQTYGGLPKIIDKTGYKLTMDFLIPPKGKIYLQNNLNGGAPIINDQTITTTIEKTFTQASPADVSFDPIQMLFNYSIVPPEAGTVMDGNVNISVPNICFPLPLRSHPNDCYSVNASGTPGISVWDPTQQWVVDPSDAGVPKRPVDAIIANADKDLHSGWTVDQYLFNFGSITTKQQDLRVPIFSKLYLSGATDAYNLNYTFDDLSLEKTITASAGSEPPRQLSLKIEDQLLHIIYPRTESNATKINWNPAVLASDDDPVLKNPDNNGNVKGYVRVGTRDPVWNPNGLSAVDAFDKETYYPYGPWVNIGDAYMQLADKLGITIPSISSTDENASRFLCHLYTYGGYRSCAVNTGNGLTLNSWGTPGNPVNFEYINGEVNDNFDGINFSSNGQYQIDLKGNATLKRIVPIEFVLDAGKEAMVRKQLLVYNQQEHGWVNLYDQSYNSVFKESSKTLEAGKNGDLIGYWDVTGMAGTFYIRFVGSLGGVEYSATTSIRIGTEVTAGRTSPVTVTCPLKRVALTFPVGSKYEGMVSVDPIKPENAKGFDWANAPKGFLVDVTPSGLIFNENNDASKSPQLTFYLTKKDIQAIGGDPADLGSIGIYYFDDKQKKLVNASFAAQLYKLNEGTGNWEPYAGTFDDDCHLQLKGNIYHTSIYGALASGSFIEINPPLSPTSSSNLSLTGKVSPDHSSDITLYISNTQPWSPSTATKLTNPVSVDPVSGNWSVSGITLPFEGSNYIYASLGDAVSGTNEPSNSISIVRDTRSPVIQNLTVLTGIKNDAAEVRVVLNEPGEVYLVLPGILDKPLYTKAELPGNEAVFSIPLVDKAGTPLPEGDYNVFATANDIVGNVTGSANTAILHIDRQPPVFKSFNVASRFDAISNFYKVDINGIVRDASGLQNLHCLIRSGKPDWVYDHDCAGLKEVTFNGTINLTGYEDIFKPGDLLYCVIEATDLSGNKTDYERSFILEDHESLTKWSHSKSVSINIPNTVTDDLTDFPVVIRLDKANFNFSETSADGHDVRFAKDGFILPHEIETWDPVAGKAVIWVRMTEITPGDQEQSITMYWGNDSARVPTFGKLVWDNYFRAVFHMNSQTVDGETPVSPNVIYSEEKTDIRDRVQLTGQKLESNGYIEIGADADVKGDVYCSDSAFFREHASISGNVTLGQRLTTQQNVTITGGLHENSLVPHVEIPKKEVTCGSESKDVYNGMVLDLLPGNYGNIIIYENGKLKLHEGVYNLNNLQFEAGALFEVDIAQGKVLEVNTNSLIRIGDRVQCETVGDQSGTNIHFYSNQKDQFYIGCTTRIFGSIIAPYAAVVFSPGAHFTGSIMARSVTVEPQAVIQGFSAEQTSPITQEYIQDATIHGLNAEKSHTELSQGIIGAAQEFNGITSYIKCPNLLRNPADNQMTISGWLRKERTGINENIIGMNGISQSFRFLTDNDENYIIKCGTDQVSSNEDKAKPEDWVNFACTYNGNKVRFFINGDFKAEKAVGSPIPVEDVPYYIGKWIEENYYQGKIDEIEVSDIARCNSWISLSYENQKEISRVAAVPPVAPQGVQVTPLSPSSVKITWEVLPSVDQIEIERTEKSSTSWATVARIPVSNREYIDSNLECSKDFLYRFRYSVSNMLSDYSKSDTVNLNVCVGEKPTGLQAEAISENSIKLTWTDNATGEDAYEIHSKLHTDEQFVHVLNTPPDATSSTINNLICEKEYDFRLRTVKGDHYSEWAYALNIPTYNCNRKPSRPSNLVITPSGTGKVLSWTDNSENEEYFIIYRALSKTPSDTNLQYDVLDLVPGGITQYEDKTCPCGNYIAYKVAAFNSVQGGGISDPTNIVRFQSTTCVENNGNKLLSLSFMLIDNHSSPVSDQKASVTVKLYIDQLSVTSVYDETFATNIRNGYMHINLGTFKDISSVLNDHSSLYYEIIYNGVSIPGRYPLASGVNAVTNSMMIQGKGSPLGSVDAVTGSLYFNTEDRSLYFKFGKSMSDWKKVE